MDAQLPFKHLTKASLNWLHRFLFFLFYFFYFKLRDFTIYKAIVNATNYKITDATNSND